MKKYKMKDIILIKKNEQRKDPKTKQLLIINRNRIKQRQSKKSVLELFLELKKNFS